jgi:cytochrome P450
MPPYHPVFGHLPVVFKTRSKLPSDIHIAYLPSTITQDYPEVGRMFYLDLWPFSEPMLVINSAPGIHQLTQEHACAKSPMIRQFMESLTFGKDLVTMEGQQWKKWRTIFNPGFSPSHLLSLVPLMVEDVQVFVENLRERAAKDEIFQLESLTTNLAIDVIGRVAL